MREKIHAFISYLGWDGVGPRQFSIEETLKIARVEEVKKQDERPY
jgi:hypothetical protein